jgi:hypothetical protein
MRGDGEDDPDKLELQQYRKRVRSVSALFLRGSNNAVEEIEKLGFTYVVDENEDGDEIDEERSARPITADQISLVSYLESTVSPDEDWLTLWRSETMLDDTPFALWRRFFRAGNTQLKNLLLFGLDRVPTDRGLLAQLAFLHGFLFMPKELLARYERACDQENDPQRFRALAQEFGETTDSFGYDALAALRERYTADPAKTAVIDMLFAEMARGEEGISF